MMLYDAVRCCMMMYDAVNYVVIINVLYVVPRVGCNCYVVSCV